ncbi:MAG: enoyl-CoA hydratase-related protein, partial [Myxococcota bacterium]
DIAAMQNMTEEQGRAFGALGHAVFDAVQGLRFPVIAAVNGFALGGGCELALACDFVYASSKARFGQPEVGLGIIPGFGGTQRLTRRVGSAMAKELVLTGRMIGADEALRIGLANAVVAPEELLPAVQKVASEISEKGPIAVSTAKRLIDEGIHLPLSEANALERDAFGACFGTEDQSEGMAAFLEKRGANFSGR